ncbi:hypothetical protein M0812_01804 [Anaeramoeba flamelloides]|uniref:Uncharacterized protein n=1 Tax=Anaeramoeba flamelloides TaxID=1746091 RepID=A0AAV7YY42_9EUKA|nr:hypothetical protein M0812_01804 [Anaeramoeba flamelloides]
MPIELKENFGVNKLTNLLFNGFLNIKILNREIYLKVIFQLLKINFEELIGNKNSQLFCSFLIIILYYYSIDNAKINLVIKNNLYLLSKISKKHNLQFLSNFWLQLMKNNSKLINEKVFVQVCNQLKKLIIGKEQEKKIYFFLLKLMINNEKIIFKNTLLFVFDQLYLKNKIIYQLPKDLIGKLIQSINPSNNLKFTNFFLLLFQNSQMKNDNLDLRKTIKKIHHRHHKDYKNQKGYLQGNKQSQTDNGMNNNDNNLNINNGSIGAISNTEKKNNTTRFNDPLIEEIEHFPIFLRQKWRIENIENQKVSLISKKDRIRLKERHRTQLIEEKKKTLALKEEKLRQLKKRIEKRESLSQKRSRATTQFQLRDTNNETFSTEKLLTLDISENTQESTLTIPNQMQLEQITHDFLDDLDQFSKAPKKK